MDRQEFLEMEDLERKYIQLVLQAESAVEETNPTVRNITRFSQCFLSGGINCKCGRAFQSIEAILLPRLRIA